MSAKAYRWVAEMEEIAEFLGEDEAAATMFRGLSRLYERLAADYRGAKGEISAIEAFLSPAERATEASSKIAEISEAR
jgi:hypothetical protein